MEVRIVMKQIYIYSAVVIFYLSSVGKFIAFARGDRSLIAVEPIFGFRYGTMLLAAAIIEAVLGTYCVVERKRCDRCVLFVFSFSALLLAYRTGLWIADWRQPCSCMGVLTSGLGISFEASDLVVKSLLFYLLGMGCVVSRFGQSCQAVSGAEK